MISNSTLHRRRHSEALVNAAEVVERHENGDGGLQVDEGDPKVTSTFEGQTFNLTNAMVKQMFDKDPAKYAPAYQGYCAASVAKGMKLVSDPELFSVVEGKTCLFSTKEAKQMFDADKAGMIAMGKKNWPAVSKQAVAK